MPVVEVDGSFLYRPAEGLASAARGRGDPSFSATAQIRGTWRAGGDDRALLWNDSGATGRHTRYQQGMSRAPYDPTIYRGSAAYYVAGRPPYSAVLAQTLASELGLDGTGRLLDVGCGPGILAIELARYFEETVGLDPDAEMLAEGAARAANAGLETIRWVQAVAEDLPTLDLGTFRLVTFGQSFHWTDRESVAEAVYDLLVAGGALALIVHTSDRRSPPAGPGHPPIPHDAIRTLVDRYLGPRARAGQGFARRHPDRFEDALARTRFGAPRTVVCEGRPDVLRDIDGVVASYFSTSFAAPHLFGAQAGRFEAEVRAELAARSPSGLFWDWPGDTAILLAHKPV
jgi:SAM-dependent methyltransferase